MKLKVCIMCWNKCLKDSNANSTILWKRFAAWSPKSAPWTPKWLRTTGSKKKVCFWDLFNQVNNIYILFLQKVEVKDDDKESYADIKIPDFKDGRQGRFIHDFKNNQTTIVDESAKRCFIYPLDYATTLPPKSMADVFVKMQTGYCKLLFDHCALFAWIFSVFRFPWHQRAS